MKIVNLLFLFCIVNGDLDHEHSHAHSVSDGHSSQHSYRISHSDTGFSIEYVGNSAVKNYLIFSNFENEIENRFVLDGINNNYTIVNYANNIELHDSTDHTLECLYYSKVVNNLNYTILNYENVTFHSALVHINSDYSFCLKKDIHEEDHSHDNSVLLYPILVVCLCLLVVVLIIVSISCGVMRHRAIAHVHTFTRNHANAREGIQIPELEIGTVQTLEHVHT
tara:strand:- start:15451 stop:16119 length:669 start_codon:yes stop_codon:yes gene_type:complete